MVADDIAMAQRIRLLCEIDGAVTKPRAGTWHSAILSEEPELEVLCLLKSNVKRQGLTGLHERVTCLNQLRAVGDT